MAARKTTKTADQVAAENAAAARTAKFEALRNRARSAGVYPEKKVDPYVIGADYGVDPEIVVNMPTASGQEQIDAAIRSENPWRLARTLLGERDYKRLMAVLDTEDDGDILLVMIADEITSHLFGRGLAAQEQDQLGG